tara:strand:+ start:2902 stop:3024 length:123 start_codon:yes stop_codon:yes gene_type:complete
MTNEEEINHPPFELKESEEIKQPAHFVQKESKKQRVVEGG